MSGSENKRVQALVLSGGGVRGLYTITLLAKLEERISKGDPNYSIAQHFDFISGTSIGGIFALALASGKTARSLFQLIDENRKVIFPTPEKQGFVSSLKRKFKQGFSTAFTPEQLRNVVGLCVGDIKLRDLKYRVIIPTVNATNGLPKTLKTPHHPEFTWDGEHKVLDVALATSAAPTYLPAHAIGNGLMVDGGLFANSPSFITYHELTNSRFLNYDPESIHMLTIGTMGSESKLPPQSNGDKGYINDWDKGQLLVELMMGVSEYWQNIITTHYIGDRHKVIDDKNVHDIDLTDASDTSANLLKRYGEEKAQALFGDKEIKEFFNHKAPKPVFYDSEGEPL